MSKFYESGTVVESARVDPFYGLDRIERRQHTRGGLVVGQSVWALRGGKVSLHGWYPASVWQEHAEEQAALHYHQLLGRLG